MGQPEDGKIEHNVQWKFMEGKHPKAAGTDDEEGLTTTAVSDTTVCRLQEVPDDWQYELNWGQIIWDNG